MMDLNEYILGELEELFPELAEGYESELDVYDMADRLGNWHAELKRRLA